MSDLKEYEDNFKLFFDKFFLFQTGKKKYQTCPGCSTKKRFSINKGKLTYACGPKGGEKKCGPQWTIELPKYIDYDEIENSLLNIIHGRLEDIASDQCFDLKSLTALMEDTEVIGDLKKQEVDVTNATTELQGLREKLVKDNQLTEKNTMIQDLAKRRLKNAQDKALKMQKLLSDDISAEEKSKLRTEYAQIVFDEKREIIPMISELRVQRSPILMTELPKVIKYA